MSDSAEAPSQAELTEVGRKLFAGPCEFIWAAAVVHSYRQYRKDRALESADALAVEANVVASLPAEIVAEEQVPAGRPSAPRD